MTAVPLRNIAVFECSTFGAPVWSDAAQAVRVAEPLANAIAQQLSRDSIGIVEPVTVQGSYGWAFMAQHARTRVWCMLQRSDGWLLITEPRRTLLDRLHGSSFKADHAAFCLALDTALRRIPGVTDMRWLTRREFERRAPGGKHPGVVRVET